MHIHTCGQKLTHMRKQIFFLKKKACFETVFPSYFYSYHIFKDPGFQKKEAKLQKLENIPQLKENVQCHYSEQNRIPQWVSSITI